MPEHGVAHITSVSTTVASTVLKAFQCLPKTGKPQGHEHTVLAGNSCTEALLVKPKVKMNVNRVLAGFVITRAVQAASESHVVAIGTGTKCLSAQKRTCQVTLSCQVQPRVGMHSRELQKSPRLYQLLCKAAIASHPVQAQLLAMYNCSQESFLQGDLINDSHAEVIAKRALYLWLYGELDAAFSQVLIASRVDNRVFRPQFR